MAFYSRRNFRAHGGHFRIGRMACSLCNHYIMGSSAYVIILGLIGTVVTAFDIIRTINYKIPRTSSRNNQEMPFTVERDLKLMMSILGIEHYTLIMLGAITEYPMLHTPWLLMQLCVIIVEIIVFFVRFFLDGLHVKRNEILQATFTLFNWLQVFCLFHQQIRRVI
ncbi:PREDICTED: uncharacterized protein LOC105457666 [Wasmannia auropunctata]|uniref:uncharacterized protein LOC105457666 n=1 Tax=Wasmannia auropunctata TaxID=64793 RepID=UPI0005EDA313|nr:PREDICTED: uncharacterized protein LOC105457666 [Wasmannia auropunctata]